MPRGKPMPHGMRSATTAHRHPFVDLLVVQLLYTLAEECEGLVNAQVYHSFWRVRGECARCSRCTSGCRPRIDADAHTPELDERQIGSNSLDRRDLVVLAADPPKPPDVRYTAFLLMPATLFNASAAAAAAAAVAAVPP